jgi:WD40 repeat protein
MKTSCVVLAVSTIAVSAYASAKFTDWSAPRHLGPVVNSPFNDFQPSISKDGLSLYFASDRLGTFGGLDLYVSHRTSSEEPWAAPINLGPVLNTQTDDQAPALSRDGHYLFFSTNRLGGLGGLDIWISYRARTHDDFAWEAPVPITEINSVVNDAGPSFFENEEGRPQLYFNSLRLGGAGLADIYLTELQDDGTWSPPTAVAELNTPFQEQRPSVRFDGLEIVFGSTRPGSAAFDLWTSTRESVTAAWSPPVPLDINTAGLDFQPGLSGGGMTLYFSSSRPGGVGSTDLWVSTRQRRRGKE